MLDKLGGVEALGVVAKISVAVLLKLPTNLLKIFASLGFLLNFFLQKLFVEISV